MDDSYAIDVSGLRKSYGPVGVLRGVDLRVERGTMLALLGSNGAGKTTTVRVLSTLVKPDAGTAKVNGFDVATQAGAVRRSIGLTGQQAAVDGYLTGYENLVMMGRLFRLRPRAARARAAELLERFDLAQAGKRAVRTYSGGMRRRLDIAISLVTAPPVLFLDEPTTGLDPRSRHAVWDMARALLGSGTTILLTTQYLAEADELADRVVVVDGGRVVAEGTPAELKQRVGAERLVLTFADADAFRTACRILGGTQRGGDPPTLALTVPVNHVKDVKRALDDLAASGVEPDGLALDAPSLDDVFLTVTGEPAGGTR